MLILRNGLRHGPRPAISASIGRFTAFALMVVAVAAGLGAVLTASEVAFNALLDPAAPEPVITGVLDFDRTWFGDPAADWTIRMATAKADEREAFWESYGVLDRSPAAMWRARVYEARHLGAIRLECHRLAKADAVRESYGAMAEVLAGLT
nr:hypothetical protein [Streptomyces sp. MK37H]